MNWRQRHRLRQYVRDALWLGPTLGMVAGLVAVRALHALELALGWEAVVHPDGARAVLGALASAMFTFIVFVSSALLVAFQLASAQLSPRIIAIVFRDPVTKWSVAVFIFAFTVTLATLARITDTVPWLTTQVSTYSSMVSLGVFLYLIDHVGKVLRPSGAVLRVGLLGRQVIEAVYPRLLGEGPSEEGRPMPERKEGTWTVVPSPGDGVLLAFDLAGLADLARGTDSAIELVPEVGDFVAAGDPLFRVSAGAAPPPSAQGLCAHVALGQERTMEQDPMFAFRILVDIAAKALSPAINDPTSAVLALDQLHHLLRSVGTRRLDEGQVRGHDGRLLLVYQTPNWEDFVQLAVTEIRHFGGGSIQIARRLRAMLENLIQVLPEPRRPALEQELSLLQKTADRSFPEPGDRAMADVSDVQGVGGTHAPRGGAAR